jgi:hypothetical protein
VEESATFDNFVEIIHLPWQNAHQAESICERFTWEGWDVQIKTAFSCELFLSNAHSAAHTLLLFTHRAESARER